MIDGTVSQATLIKFKSKDSHVPDDVADLSKVSEGYWSGFMKQNSHLIGLSRDHKYKLDRSSWTIYADLDDMYRHKYIKILSVGVG